MTTRFDNRLEKIMTQLEIESGQPFRGCRLFTKSEYAAWLESPEGQAHIAERAGPWRRNESQEFTGFHIVVGDSNRST